MQLAHCATAEHEIAASDSRSWESLYVLSVPWFAGISSFSGLTIAGFRYTGFIWLAYMALGILIVLWHRHDVRFPVRYWVPLVAFAFISMLWGGGHGAWQFQIVAQMTAPLVVGMVASVVVRTEEQAAALERSFLYCLVIILTAFLFFYFGPGRAWHNPEEGIGFNVRPAAMTVSLISCLLITGVRTRGSVLWLMWGLSLMVTVFTGSRMATAAILLVPMLNPLRRGLLVRVALLVGMLALAWALFSTPIFQNRFFGDTGGTLAELRVADFDSSGRYTIWPILLKEAWRQPLLGSGIGTSSAFLIQQGFELHHPHNEYLRVGFELGILGLALFCGAVLWQAVDAYRNMCAASGIARKMFAAGLLCLGVLLVMSVTDNPLVYNLSFTHPLFVLLGAAYGMKDADQTENQR